MDEWTKRDHKSEKLAFEAVKVVCKKSLDSFIFNVFRDSFRMSWHGIAQTLNLSLTLKFLLDFFLISIWLANKKNLLSKKIISHRTDDDDDGWRFDVLFLCLYAYAWSFDPKACPTGWHKRKYEHIHTHTTDRCHFMCGVCAFELIRYIRSNDANREPKHTRTHARKLNFSSPTTDDAIT